MGDINLKFKATGTNTAAGVIWLMVGLMNVHQLIIFLKLFPITLLILLNILLDFPLAIYHLTLYKRTYIGISSGVLSIHRNLILRNYKIKFSEISSVRVSKNKLFIIPIDSFPKKEVLIRTNLLYIKDYEKLLEEFNSYGIVVKNLLGDIPRRL
jgi:hypothetical protein